MPSDKPSKKERISAHVLPAHNSSPSLLSNNRLTNPPMMKIHKPMNAFEIFKILDKIDSILERSGSSIVKKSKHSSMINPMEVRRKRTVSSVVESSSSSGSRLPRHSIRLDKDKEKDKDISKKHKKRLVLVVKEFLEAVAIYGKGPNELFYDRLVESGSLISADFLLYLNESLAQYVEASLSLSSPTLSLALPRVSITVEDVSSNVSSGNDESRLRNIAINMLNYLETHAVDPDNALIGLEVASTLIAKYNIFIEKYRLTNYKPGDLVVCRIDETAIFVRVHHINVITQQVQVMTSPKEAVSTHPMSQIYALPPEIIEMTKQERSMRSMVVDPCVKFFDDVGKAITNITIDFLSQSLGIEKDLLVRLQEHKLRIIDLCILDSVLCKITSVLEQPLQQEMFEKAISKETAKLLGQFMNNLDLTKVLVPLRDMMWVQLSQHTLTKLAINNLWSLRMNCESSITQLGDRIDEILSGRAKAKVTSWWLNRIETSCNGFLQTLNYDFEAIPANYIEEPPTSIRSVQTNLGIIQEILNPRADVHGLKPFIIKLRGEIQPKLDELQADSEDVLQFRYNITLSSSLRSPVVKKDKEYAREEAFKEPTPTLPLSTSMASSKHVSVASLVEDIKYMRQMKAMEKEFDDADNSKSKHLTLTNVVPISGLILARFHIIENELQTILDVWKHLLPKNEVFESAGRASGNRMQTLLQKHLEQATLLSHTVSDGKNASIFSLPTRVVSLRDVKTASKIEVELEENEAWDLIVWVF
eukprot:TRINITY_DN16465_c0_g1_i1.p1 TRINITY_DN16465_c0_g1~~TRINITY_DN16465_c0_g1_i1.p1  ORF type:complete len:760 (-),score=107.96 TRINITY_DN16465_c0_g1_i1:62-2341(-)